MNPKRLRKESPGKKRQKKSTGNGKSTDERFILEWYHRMPETFKRANALIPGEGIAFNPLIPTTSYIPPPEYYEGVIYVKEESDAKDEIRKLDKNSSCKKSQSKISGEIIIPEGKDISGFHWFRNITLRNHPKNEGRDARAMQVKASKLWNEKTEAEREVFNAKARAKNSRNKKKLKGIAAQLLTENNSLRNQLKDMQLHYESVSEKNLALKCENQLIMNENERLKVENDDIKEENEDLEDRIDELYEEIDSLTEENFHLHDDI